MHVHVTYRLVEDKTWTRGTPDWWESQSQLPWLLYNPCTWLIELSGPFSMMWNCINRSLQDSLTPSACRDYLPFPPPFSIDHVHVRLLSHETTQGQVHYPPLLSPPPSPPFPHFYDQVHVRLFQHGNRNNWRCASVAKAPSPVGVSKGRRSDYRGRCQWLCKWGHILPTWSLWSDTG